MTTHDIKIKIRKIEVDEYYYSFEWSSFKDGKMWTDWEQYSGDHSWQDDEENFKKHLEDGGALSAVLEMLSHE